MVTRLLQRALILLAVLLGMGAVPATAQQRTELVQTPQQAGQIGLGYPPPEPVDSTLPVAGFRRYASLLARLQDLALRSPDLQTEVIGRTDKGRSIHAYVLGKDAAVDDEGVPRAAMLVNGTIHAREWQSPEVAAGIIEHWMAQAGDAGLMRFLLDHMDLVIVPVLNVDGFLQTQAQPRSTWVGADPGNATYPRDGRLRRKNLRETDELFDSTADHLHGVDLNRNFGPYFGTSNQSSSDRRSIVHRGPFAHSEPESQALLTLADRYGPRLRLYSDLHSFSRILYSISVDQPRTQPIRARIAHSFALHHQAISRDARMPGGRWYPEEPDTLGSGTGYSAEYFAHRFQIPAWTLEIEPGFNGAQEYGAPGWHHDGFILPASEISRVRTQLAASHAVLALQVAGPAHVRAISLHPVDGEQTWAESRWHAAAGHGLRPRTQTTWTALTPGRYRVRVVFDRPMRMVDGAGQARLLEGQEGAVMPTLGWMNGSVRTPIPVHRAAWVDRPVDGVARFERYRGDTWVAEIEWPQTTGPTVRLAVDAVDLVGRALDALPDTPVQWRDGSWTGYQGNEGLEGDVGGTDRTTVWSLQPQGVRLLDPAVVLQEGVVSRLGFSLPPGMTGMPEVVAAAPLQATRVGPVANGQVQVDVRVPDDLDLQPERVLRLQVAGTEWRLPVMDNDSATQGTWHALDAAEAGQALAHADARPLHLVLPAAADWDWPPANTTPRVQTSVRVDGRGSTLRLAAAQRAFDVQTGGSLHLHDLHLLGGGGTELDGGQIRNAGSLALDAVHSLGARGQCGGVVHSSGTLRVVRSVWRDAMAVRGGALCATGGDATLDSVMLDRLSAAEGAAVYTRAPVRLRHVTLRDAVAGSGAVLQAEHSAIALQASVLSALQGRHCQGEVRSEGGNLGHPRVCETAPNPADQVLTESPLRADPGTLAGWRPATSAPRVAGSDPAACAGVDLAGWSWSDPAGCDAGALRRGVFPRPGVWWNPARSGEGLDLRPAGGGLLVLYYTYEADGSPITWTVQGEVVDGRFVGELLGWRRAPVSRSPQSHRVGQLSLSFHDPEHATLDLALDGAAPQRTALEAFRLGAELPHAHTYSGGGDYGLSLLQEGELAYVLVYAYAADEVLRWVSAQGDPNASRLRLTGFDGACPHCPWRAPRAAESGWVRLQGTGLPTATLDLSLRLARGPGGHQQLDAAPLQRFD